MPIISMMNDAVASSDGRPGEEGEGGDVEFDVDVELDVLEDRRPGASSTTAISVASTTPPSSSSSSSSPPTAAPSSSGARTTTPVTYSGSPSHPPGERREVQGQERHLTPVVPPSSSSSSSPPSSSSFPSSSSGSGDTFHSAGSSFSPEPEPPGVGGGVRLSFGSEGGGVDAPGVEESGGDEHEDVGNDDIDDDNVMGGDDDQRSQRHLDSPTDVGGVVRRLIRNHGDVGESDGVVGVGGGGGEGTNDHRGDDEDDSSGEGYGRTGSDDDDENGDDEGGDEKNDNDEEDKSKEEGSASAPFAETNDRDDSMSMEETDEVVVGGQEAFFTPDKEEEEAESSPLPGQQPPTDLPENGEEGGGSSPSQSGFGGGTDAEAKTTPRQGGGDESGDELDEEELEMFVSSPAAKDLGQFRFAFLWRAMKNRGWKYSATNDTYHAPALPEERPTGEDGDGDGTKKKKIGGRGRGRGEGIGNSEEVIRYLDHAAENPDENPRATELRREVLREMCKLGKREEEARAKRERAREQREAQKREKRKGGGGEGDDDVEIDEEEMRIFLSSPASKDFREYDFRFLWKALQRCGWTYGGATYYAPPMPVERHDSGEDGDGDGTKKKKSGVGRTRGEAIGSCDDVIEFLDDATTKRGCGKNHHHPRAAELRHDVLREICRLGKREEAARQRRERAREERKGSKKKNNKSKKNRKQQRKKTNRGNSRVGTASAGGKKNSGGSATVQKTGGIHHRESSFGRTRRGGRGSEECEAETAAVNENENEEGGDVDTTTMLLEEEDEIEAFLVETDVTTIPFLRLWRILSDEMGWTHSGSTYYTPPTTTTPAAAPAASSAAAAVGRGEEIGSAKEVMAFLDGKHDEIVGLSARFVAGTASTSPEEMRRVARAMRGEVLRRYYVSNRGEIREAWGAKAKAIGGGIGVKGVTSDGEDEIDEDDDGVIGRVLSRNSVHEGGGGNGRKRPLRSATAIEDGAAGYLRKKRPAVGPGTTRRTTRPRGNKAGATKADDRTESNLMHGDATATASGGNVGEGRGGPRPQRSSLRWPRPQACVEAVLNGTVCAIHGQVGHRAAAERPDGDVEAVCTCDETYASARERCQRRKFGKWRFLLETGHSLMLYGFGSKKNLLDDFCKEELLAKEERGTRVIKIQGYRREANISSILDILVHTLLDGHEPVIESNCAFEGFCIEQDDSDELGKPALPIWHGVIKRAVLISRTIAASRTFPVFIVVHNIDGPGLRNHVAQIAFASLVANSVVDGTNLIRLVASVDHVDAAASLWDTTTNANFAWIWQEVTTYRRYYEEVRLGMEDPTRSIRTREQKRTTAPKDSSGIINVLASLAPRHVETVKLLAKIQSEPQVGTAHGVEFKNFFAQCRKEIFLRSDRDLRSYLGELRDHGIADMETGPDGRELVIIPHSLEVLKTITDYVVKK